MCVKLHANLVVLGLALLISACSVSSSLTTPRIPNGADYVPGTSLAWSRILSSNLSESDRQLLRNAIGLTPATVRSALTESAAVFVVTSEDGVETIHANRPELANLLKQYKEDPSGGVARSAGNRR